MTSLGTQKMHNKRVPIKRVNNKNFEKSESKQLIVNLRMELVEFITSTLDGHQLNNIITIFRDPGQNFFCKFIITRDTFFVGRDTHVRFINSGRFYFFRTVKFLRITLRRIVKMPIEDWRFRFLKIGSSLNFLNIQKISQYFFQFRTRITNPEKHTQPMAISCLIVLQFYDIKSQVLFWNYGGFYRFRLGWVESQFSTFQNLIFRIEIQFASMS